MAMIRQFQTIELRAIAKKIKVGWLPKKPSPGMAPHLMIHSDLQVSVVYPETRELTPKELQTLFAPLLSELARKYLAPRLLQLAGEHGFSRPSLVRIGSPRTRWASRSSSGAISLNYLLLFLPEALVTHVLLHELCHTMEMNHGPRFYSLLRANDPHAMAHDSAVKSASRDYIPYWQKE